MVTQPTCPYLPTVALQRKEERGSKGGEERSYCGALPGCGAPLLLSNRGSAARQSGGRVTGELGESDRVWIISLKPLLSFTLASLKTGGTLCWAHMSGVSGIPHDKGRANYRSGV